MILKGNTSNGRCAVDREFVDIIGTLGGFGENLGDPRGTRGGSCGDPGKTLGSLGGDPGGSREVPLAPLGSQDVVQEPTGLVQEIMELKEPFQAFLGGSMCANHQFLQQDLRFWNS